MSRSNRDPNYRPGITRIVDDFAVIPQIPEERFRRHTERYSAFDDDIEIEFQVPDEELDDSDGLDIIYDEPDEPLEENRPKTPENGYDGQAIGMSRCQDCKTWCDPDTLDSETCKECKENKDVEENK